MQVSTELSAHAGRVEPRRTAGQEGVTRRCLPWSRGSSAEPLRYTRTVRLLRARITFCGRCDIRTEIHVAWILTEIHDRRIGADRKHPSRPVGLAVVEEQPLLGVADTRGLRGSEPGEPLGGDRLDPLSVRAGVDQE